MSLIVHAGANRVSREQIAALPLPAARGARHCVRPFIDDIDIVTDLLGVNGLAIVEEAFAVKTINNTPAQFFGFFEVAPKALEGEFIPAGTFALQVGLRGSYDQSLPRGLAVGSRVFICDNLCVSSDIVIHTKQTTFVGDRIPALLADAVSKIPAAAEAQEKKFDAYRNYELKPRVGDAALVELVRRGALNPSSLGKAIAEWDEPSHAEHADQGYSVWRLQQAVTEAFKPTNQERGHFATAWERGIILDRFLSEIVGLAPVVH
jgi:hypothetical protein